MKSASRTVTVSVNGAPVTADVEVRTLLSDFLRTDAGLTGTHVGCEHGVCGACTVVVDGEAVRSCLMLAVQADGRQIETVESLGTSTDLNALQQSMSAQHGLQCGFCTPGILMSVTAAERQGQPKDEVVDDVLSGHLCRCTGYQGIRAAIEDYWAKVAP